MSSDEKKDKEIKFVGFREYILKGKIFGLDLISDLTLSIRFFCEDQINEETYARIL